MIRSTAAAAAIGRALEEAEAMHREQRRLQARVEILEAENAALRGELGRRAHRLTAALLRRAGR